MSFLGMNPPDHTRLRRLALPAFTPKAVARYTARMERTAADLLDAAAVAGRFDLVSGFAAPLPIAVITDLPGIPDSRAEDFARYGRAIGGSLDGIKSVQHARRLLAARADLRRLFGPLFELRRREPRDDIISHLVAAEGEQLEPREMVALEPVELEGQRVRQGQQVITLIGAANRDPAAYPDPDTFDSTRTEGLPHLASPPASTTASATPWPAPKPP